MSSMCRNHVAHCCIAWSLCVVTWLVVLPWSSFRFYQLWVRRHAQILFVRRVQLDLLSIIFLNCVGCVNICLFMLRTVAGAKVGPYPVHRLLLAVGVFHVAVVIIYKALLSHIDLRFAYISRELSWKSLIITDPDSHHDLMDSRYLRWRRTWLSPRYLAAVMAVYGFLGTLLLVLLEVIGFGDRVGLANTLLLASLTTVIFYLWFRTPSIFDTFGIRKEIGMIGLFAVCGMIAFVFLLTAMGPLGKNDAPLDYLLTSVVFLFEFYSILYVFTEHRYRLLSETVQNWNSDTARSVRRSHEKAQVRSNKLAKQMTNLGMDAENLSESAKNSADPSSIAGHSRLAAPPNPRSFATRAITKSVMAQINPSVSKEEDIFADIENQPAKKLITDRLFAHADCIAVFADFLFREISIENLIGLIEFYQLSVSLTSEMDECDVLHDFSLNADVVPLSSINQRICQDDCSVLFILLCDKYVGHHSVYRLNLPFTLVDEVNRMIKDIEMMGNRKEKVSEEMKLEILDLTLEILRECINLLNDSFTRFKSDPLFNEFLKIDIARPVFSYAYSLSR